MIILDRPYISELLKDTIKRNGYPVLRTRGVEEFGLDGSVELLDGARAVELIANGAIEKIYTASENSIGWIADNLGFTGLPGKIRLFKDKARFREMTRSLYPNLFFTELSLDGLETAPVDSFPIPFVVKPSVGFFSLGVYKVASPEDWPRVAASIKKEVKEAGRHYNEEVLDGGRFIVEEEIRGEEFAFDAYYDSGGEPFVLGIFKHIFASGDDVSDRVYLTSPDVVEENLGRFTSFLETIGEMADLRDFPLHVEVRIDESGKQVPIEVNPMRFGAWCTTADLTTHAYGFNPYEYYFEGVKPDWGKLLAGKEGKIFSLVLLDNSTGVDGSKIESFDYEGVLERLEKPLTLRKVDFREYPVFGFIFAETAKENYGELEDILRSDLSEFIR